MNPPGIGSLISMRFHLFEAGAFVTCIAAANWLNTRERFYLFEAGAFTTPNISEEQAREIHYQR